MTRGFMFWRRDEAHKSRRFVVTIRMRIKAANGEEAVAEAISRVFSDPLKTARDAHVEEDSLPAG